MTQPSCETCRFSRPKKIGVDKENFECHFNPPSLSDQTSYKGIPIIKWPMLPGDEWCGRWESQVTEAVIQETQVWIEQPSMVPA